jgi:aryl-alcohol dehydrogenase-like predicted oxidoreductase
MVNFCQEQEIKFLPYGTLCGGLLSEKYWGQPESNTGMLNATSLKKYKKMLDAWGNWSLFQKLLSVLKNMPISTMLVSLICQFDTF